MSVFILNGTEEVTEVIPISDTDGCTVDLITVRRVGYQDPLTRIFTSLPEEVYAHCVHSAVIVRTMAEYIKSPPEGMNRGVFAHSVWLGCLYHHLGESAGGTKDKQQLPALTESILNEHLPDTGIYFNTDKNIVLDIVRHCHERFDGSGCPDGLSGDEIPLTARLCGLACVLDNLLAGKGFLAANTVKAARYMQEKGGALFGADAINCYEQAREEIFNLYLNQRKRLEGWD